MGLTLFSTVAMEQQEKVVRIALSQLSFHAASKAFRHREVPVLLDIRT